MRTRRRRDDVSSPNPPRAIRRAVGVALLAVVLAGIGYPLWWGQHSALTAKQLLRRTGIDLSHSRDPQRSPGTPPCVLTSTPSSAGSSSQAKPSGVLEVPSISVIAPVLDGTDDAVLTAAVGHDPSTPWPGAVGTSILLAHDVSFFSHIDELNPGQPIVWQSGCSKSTFEVTGSAVMRPGQSIPPQSSGIGLALVTCWPTDALWWTPQRYVVEAKFVSTTIAPPQRALTDPGPGRLTVPAAPDLVAQGLSLDENPVVLGTFSVTGTPSAAYVSGPGPLDAAGAAVTEYIAARKAVESQNLQWWQSIAEPGVPMPQQWQEPGPLDLHIGVEQTQVLNVTLSSGPATMDLVVSGGAVRVASVGD
ncbi:MAG TPA: class D sortase [Acidimicrobiales bacterium]|nr:class D sortase [Acidimicrobiales bacterium]